MKTMKKSYTLLITLILLVVFSITANQILENSSLGNESLKQKVLYIQELVHGRREGRHGGDGRHRDHGARHQPGAEEDERAAAAVRLVALPAAAEDRRSRAGGVPGGQAGVALTRNAKRVLCLAFTCHANFFLHGRLGKPLGAGVQPAQVKLLQRTEVDISVDGVLPATIGVGVDVS